MELPIRRTEGDTLWRVSSFGSQHVPAGRTYWFDNLRRHPLGMVVVQAVTAGRIVLEDEQGAADVPAGHVAIFVFGEASRYGWRGSLPSDYACTWLNLQGAGLVEHVSVLRQRHGAVLDVRGAPAILTELRQLQRMARPASPAGPTDMAHAVHHLLMRLMEHAHHRLFEAQSPVERAVEQMLRQPTQPWSLKEVAERFGCSREHLSRTFRERTGQTPASYLNRARLVHALDLLRETGLPLPDVAEQAGFSSTHTLARHVRGATGQAPSALRPAAGGPRGTG